LNFENCDHAAFKQCGQDATKDLRDPPEAKGIYVRKDRGIRYNVALAEAAREEIPWPEGPRPALQGAKTSSKNRAAKNTAAVPTTSTSTAAITTATARLTEYTRQESIRLPVRVSPPLEHGTGQHQWTRQPQVRETRAPRWTPTATTEGFDGQAQRPVPSHPAFEDRVHRHVPSQRAIPVAAPLSDQGDPDTQTCRSPWLP